MTLHKFSLYKLTIGFQLALRSAVAAGLSLTIASLLYFQHPIYSLLSAVIVTDLSPAQSRELGLRRLVTTVIGAVCGAALTYVLPPNGWAVGLSILIAMLLCQLLGSPEGAKIAGFVCGIVVLDHHPEPWTSAASRSFETILGVSVALLVAYVPKLIRLEEPAAAGQGSTEAESSNRDISR